MSSRRLNTHSLAMKCSSPSAERNKSVIGDVFEKHMNCKKVFEVASGSGQHVSYLAARFPDTYFQPSEVEVERFDSINEWAYGLANVGTPLLVDTTQIEDPFPLQGFDGLMCINMIHISPYESCEGLAKLAEEILVSEGKILLYGPYIREGVNTSNSNLEFDKWLKAKDSRFGIRRLDRVSGTFETHGFSLDEVIEMPANNCVVIFKRKAR